MYISEMRGYVKGRYGNGKDLRPISGAYSVSLSALACTSSPTRHPYPFPKSRVTMSIEGYKEFNHQLQGNAGSRQLWISALPNYEEQCIIGVVAICVDVVPTSSISLEGILHVPMDASPKNFHAAFY